MIEGHVYLPRQGDREFVAEKREMFRSYTNDKLIEYYNTSCSRGFFGSHFQALHIIAVSQVFRERFARTPVKITDNVLLEFSGLIRASENGWEYVEQKNEGGL